jgi:hypothetical protein
MPRRLCDSADKVTMRHVKASLRTIARPSQQYGITLLVQISFLPIAHFASEDGSLAEPSCFFEASTMPE